jgi:hypothetical protein
MHRPCQGVSTRRDVALPIASVGRPGVPDVAIGALLISLRARRVAASCGSLETFCAQSAAELASLAPCR